MKVINDEALLKLVSGGDGEEFEEETSGEDDGFVKTALKAFAKALGKGAGEEIGREAGRDVYQGGKELVQETANQFGEKKSGDQSGGTGGQSGGTGGLSDAEKQAIWKLNGRTGGV